MKEVIDADIDADIEAENALDFLVVGERVIIAAARGGIAHDQIKDVLGFPDLGVRSGDVEFAEADVFVGGNVDL